MTTENKAIIQEKDRLKKLVDSAARRQPPAPPAPPAAPPKKG